MNYTKISRKVSSLSLNDFVGFLKEKYYLVILVAIFIFSFALDISVLTRYPLSYGIDGAFYDIQVRNILQYGFPLSNDPPLAYYLLTPFVTMVGNSFLGVKIGMAVIGSLLVFPAFLLTECYISKKDGINVGSKIPALLSAFMVTVNVNYFALISNFMQNLVGVLFLSVFLYFAIRWFEDIKQWRKFGVLTVLFLGLNLLTHIYTGALAVTLFFSLLIFSITVKYFKKRKLPLFDIKILILLSLMIVGCLAVLFMIYPVMYTKYGTVLSFLNSTSTTIDGRSMSSPVSGIIYCSLPYLLGVVSSVMILYRGLKGHIPGNGTSDSTQSPLNSNMLLSWSYICLALVLAVLSVITSSQYQSRFLLVAFLPIALLVPLGLKFLEIEFITRYPWKKRLTTLLVLGVALIFAFSSYYTASESFDSLEPTITTDEYNELLAMKNTFANVTDQNITLVAADFQTKYWVEYVLGDLGNGNTVTVLENVQGIQNQTQSSMIYSISLLSNETSSGMGPQKSSTVAGSNTSSTAGSNSSATAVGSNSSATVAGSTPNNATGSTVGGNRGGNGGLNTGFDQNSNYDLSFLLPYGPSLLPNSLDQLFNGVSHNARGQNTNINQQPGNMTNNTHMPPGNMTLGNNGPGNATNMQPLSSMNNGTNPPQGAIGDNMGQTMNIIESLSNSGTTVYSGKYFKIIRINI
jgi:hypothetical protein